MSSLVSECVCGCWFLQHALSSANRSTGINYPQMGLSNLNKCVERSRLVSLVVFLSCVCVCGSLHFGTDLSTSIYSFITDLANVNFTWLLTRANDIFRGFCIFFLSNERYFEINFWILFDSMLICRFNGCFARRAWLLLTLILEVSDLNKGQAPLTFFFRKCRF